ncbi:MAG: hypothetical protein COS94_06355 [Candidatus Hydrogenedentes bacterium CG07_land_8_20_14_0_80_42_17]|nr:MAG: hypothetical protein COS94_06355 [Candidatus Hydrogenedentes bacterium CG07_land_8_20_14_0_80_42_17]
MNNSSSISINELSKQKDSTGEFKLLPLILALGLGAIDTMVVAPLLNSIAKDIDVGVGTAGLLVTSYSIASALASPFLAPLSARFGALPLLVAGIWILFSGTTICAASPNFFVLLLGRIVAGIGGGLAMTMCHVYVAQKVPYEKRAQAVGWLGSGFFVSVIIGIPIGAFLAEHVGWRWTFGILSLVTLIVLPYIRKIPPAPCGDDFKIKDYSKIIKAKGVIPAFMAFGTMLAGISCVTTYIGAWLELDFGLTPSQVGLVYMIAGIAALFGGPFGGKVSDSVGKKRVAFIANVVMAVLVMSIAKVEVLYLAVIIVVGMHFTGSSRFPSMISMLGEAVPSNIRGPLLLANHSIILLGVSAGSYLGSLFFESRGMPSLAIIGGILNFCSAFFVLFMFDPHTKNQIIESQEPAIL